MAADNERGPTNDAQQRKACNVVNTTTYLAADQLAADDQFGDQWWHDLQPRTDGGQVAVFG